MSEQVCDPCCRDDVDAIATTLCTDCEELLCADCTRAHRRNKLSLSHVLINTDEIGSLPQSTISSQTFCDIHQDILLDFYCPHHGKTCCRTCIVDIHRSCDKVVPLSEASKNIKFDAIIDKLCTEIENIISFSDKLLQNGDDNIRDIEKQEQEIQNQISKKVINVTDEFDKVEIVLKQDQSKEVKQIQETVESREKKMESMRGAISISNKEIDFVKSWASDVQGFLQLRKAKRSLQEQAAELGAVLANVTDVSVRYDDTTDFYVNSLGNIGVEVVSCPLVYTSYTDRDKPDILVEQEGNACEIPSSEVRKALKIITGQFTEIWKGTWTPTTTKQAKESVIKIASQDKRAKIHLMDQINVLRKCEHPNIIMLYGISSGPPLSMVLEYMPRGNLSQYLVKLEAYIVMEQLEDLASIAVQVCSGMDFLCSKRIVHTDLSAKNVLIGEENVAKISGFGMAKALDQADTLKLEIPFAVPIKWTAPEILISKTVSIMSDVWSFGILMVEMMTFGQEPYYGVRKQDIVELLRSGSRHPQPDGCPDVVYDVLLRCWDDNPMERPTFEFLYNFFDTVAVINIDEQDDGTSSTNSSEIQGDNSSIGNDDNTSREFSVKNNDSQDILPKRLSKEKKKKQKEKVSKEKEKCTIS